MADKNFRVRAHRPETRMPGEHYPLILPGTYAEPAEASDVAEEWLRTYGKDGQSFCDLLFNGDEEPHASIFRIDYWRFGIWNRENVPWPIDYIDENSGQSNRMPEHPHWIAEGEDDLPSAPPSKDAEKSEKGEDATKMNLGGDDDEEEDDSEGDEGEDDPEDDDDPDEPEDGSEDDGDDQGEDDDEDDDEGEDDEGEEEDDDSENEDEDDDSESEPEQEPEMPRLTIFAKMRGPKGWRKRAEIEELNTRNVFGFKVGVLDANGETPGTQEYDVRTEIQFIEQDENRKSGVLRIKLPEGMTPDDFTQLKSGWIIAEVPYYDED